MNKKKKTIFDGSIGYFFPIDNNATEIENDPQRGYIKISHDDVLTIETLDENPMETIERHTKSIESPAGIFAITPTYPIILLDVVNTGSSTNMGGTRASIQRYSARSAIFDVSNDDLLSLDVGNVTVHFPGIFRWSGVIGAEEKFINDETGKLKEYQLTLRRLPEKSEEFNEGLNITMSAHWSVEGPLDQRVTYAPASIGCSSESPVRLWDLVYPLIRVQDLISLAYDGFVIAEGGFTHLDLAEPKSKRHDFWSHWLMCIEKGVSPAKMTEYPMFRLADIGGLSGLGRWINLCTDHLRAVKPVVDRYRRGLASPDLQLMETAAGMEYWRVSHVRTPGAGWADEKCPPRALAAHVGEPFEKWIGDPEKWIDLFWGTYNKLKHEPSFQPDFREIKLLAKIGHRLLAAELLRSAARDDSILQTYLQSPRINNFGMTARDYLQTK